MTLHRFKGAKVSYGFVYLYIWYPGPLKASFSIALLQDDFVLVKHWLSVLVEGVSQPLDVESDAAKSINAANESVGLDEVSTAAEHARHLATNYSTYSKNDVLIHQKIIFDVLVVKYLLLSSVAVIFRVP